MGITRKYIKGRNFVLTIVRGSVDDKSLSEHVKILTTETMAMHPLIELADTSDLKDIHELTEAGIAFAGSIESERTPHKEDRLAILVASEDVARLASYYTATSRYYRYDSQVFYNFNEAIEWLGVADLEKEIAQMRSDYS